MRIERTKASTFQRAAKLFPVLPSLESKKTSVDSVFFKQLWSILRLGFRHWRSKEVGILVLHSGFLVARTLLSVLVARLDGRIVRDLVSADGPGFLRGIGLWFLLAIPSTYTNSMVCHQRLRVSRMKEERGELNAPNYCSSIIQIRHLQSKLSLRLRTRLTRYVHDLYLTSAPNLRYYRVGGEGGLEGVDQYVHLSRPNLGVDSDITVHAQVHYFRCHCILRLPRSPLVCSNASFLRATRSPPPFASGNIMKPMLDLVIFNFQLSRSLGVMGNTILWVNYLTTATLLRSVTPSFARMAAIEVRSDFQN